MTPNMQNQSTILLIDDNITNLKTAMTYLRDYSFEVLTARNGQKGIEHAQLAQPDLILLDVQMPGLDGFETCSRLKANPQTQRIPIIFMTIASDVESKVKALQAGAVDYIIKPFEAEELLARVNTHLSLYKLQMHLESLVQERTAALQDEIHYRKQQQAEKEQLWETIHEQNDQFRALTQLFLENQKQNNLPQTINQQFKQNVDLLDKLLHQAVNQPEQTQTTLTKMRDIVRHMKNQTETFETALTQEQSERDNFLKNPLLQLSNREREVMELMLKGQSNSDIADLLSVARGTVSTYRRRIMEKLDVSDLNGLVRLVHEYEPLT